MEGTNQTNEEAIKSSEKKGEQKSSSLKAGEPDAQPVRGAGRKGGSSSWRIVWIVLAVTAVLLIIGGGITFAVIMLTRSSSSKEPTQAPQTAASGKGMFMRCSTNITLDQKNEPTEQEIRLSQTPLCPDSKRGRFGAKKVDINCPEPGKVILTKEHYKYSLFSEKHKKYYNEDTTDPKTSEPSRRPLYVFNDRIAAWCREKGTPRKKGQGQASPLKGNLMDRTIAYGLVTEGTAMNSIESQFAELAIELKKGSDIYIPIKGPPESDSDDEVAFKAGNKQLVHSVGYYLSDKARISRELENLIEKFGFVRE